VSSPEPDRDRIGELLKGLEDMAAGNFDRRAPISAAHDEIDAIAYTVNVLIDELRFTVVWHMRRENRRMPVSRRACFCATSVMS
jgi:hypothetical protein